MRRIPVILLLISGFAFAQPALTNIKVAASYESNRLYWDKDGNATEYRIYYATSPGVDLTSPSINTGNNSNTYVHNSLTAGTTYYYIVFAVNNSSIITGVPAEVSATPFSGSYIAGGNADGFGIESTCYITLNNVAAPPQVTGVVAAAGIEQNVLYWNPVQGAVSYTVEFSTTSSTGPWTAISPNPTVNTVVHTSLTAGTPYYYRVTVNLSGSCTGTPSNVVSATPIAQSGAGFAGGNADGQANGSTCVITLAGASASPSVTGVMVAANVFSTNIYFNQLAGASAYTVDFSTTSATGPWTTATSTLTTNTYAHTSLTANTTYYYQVTATLGSGCTANYSTVSSATPIGSFFPGGNADGGDNSNTCVITLNGAAASPSVSGLNVASSIEVNHLYWTPSTGAQSYTVEYSTSSSTGPWTTATSTLTIPNYVHTSLTAAQIYYYRITATLSGGCPTNPSASVSGTPVASFFPGGNEDGHSVGVNCFVTLNNVSSPPPVSGVTAASGIEQNILYWTPVIGVVSYTVEWGTASSGPWTALSNVTVNMIVHSSLTASQTYYYRVTANFNGNCTGSPSAVVNATPIALSASGFSGGSNDGFGLGSNCLSSLNGVGTSPAPANVKVAAGPEANSIYWDPISGATSYTLYSSATSSNFTALNTSANISYTHSSITANTAVYYQVIATLNTGCTSALSAIVSGTPTGTFFSGGNDDGGSNANSCFYVRLDGTNTPSISANGPTTFCNGGSVTLTCLTPAFNYTWFKGSTIFSTNQAIVVTDSGTYTVAINSLSACAAGSAPVVVTVGQPQTVNITGLNPIYCTTAAPVTLSASITGGTFSGPGVSGNQFTPSFAGPGNPHVINYSVTVTQTNCTSTDTAQVFVGAIPDPNITNLPGAMCNYDGPVTLIPATTGGNFSGPGINGSVFNPTNAGPGGPYSILYNITSALGCSAADTALVSVSNGLVNSFTYLNPFSNGDCWSVEQLAGNGNWNLQNTNSINLSAGSGQMFVFPSSTTNSNARSRLKSPVFNLSTLNDPVFRFRWARSNVNPASQDSVRVRVSTDGGVTWTTIRSAIRVSNTSAAWQNNTISLSQYAGQSNFRIAFDAISVGGGSDMAIDEVELYNTACSSPINLTASQITPNAATLSWANGPNGSPTSYAVRYSTSQNGPWTTASVNAPTMSYTTPATLTPSTTYYFQVRSTCGSTTVGYTTTFGTFTTLPPSGPCNVPFSLSATNLTSTSAFLSWSPLTPADSFQILVRRLNPAGPNTIIRVKRPNAADTTAHNLTAGATYSWKIRSFCGANATSTGYSDSVVFTLPTSGPCDIPIGLSHTVVNCSTAVVSWSPATPADSFQIQYRMTAPTTGPIKFLRVKQANAVDTIIYNLSCGATYYWKIRSYCGFPATTTGYSGDYYFTMPTIRMGGVQNDDPSQVILYPNPALTQSILAFDALGGEMYTLNILDITGKKVFDKVGSAESGHNLLKINVSDWPSGIYLARFMLDETETILRLTVQ